MTLRLLTIIITIFNWNITFGQGFENMNKKEMRFELSSKQLEVDSLNKVLFYLGTETTNSKKSYDSLFSVITEIKRILEKTEKEKNIIQIQNIDLDQINKTHSKIIDILNDSILYLNNQIKNEDYLRALVINKYLRKKTFKIKYYNERVGVGPQGYSFTSIAEINNKYYIGDISNGGKQTIKLADNDQQFFYNSYGSDNPALI